jgi:hypothetical protein
VAGMTATTGGTSMAPGSSTVFEVQQEFLARIAEQVESKEKEERRKEKRKEQVRGGPFHLFGVWGGGAAWIGNGPVCVLRLLLLLLSLLLGFLLLACKPRTRVKERDCEAMFLLWGTCARAKRCAPWRRGRAGLLGC